MKKSLEPYLMILVLYYVEHNVTSYVNFLLLTVFLFPRFTKLLLVVLPVVTDLCYV